MPSTRSRSSISIDSNANSKIITRNTTCKDLFSHEELEFVCKNCEADVDVLSFSKKKNVEIKVNIVLENVIKHGMNPMLPQLIDLVFISKCVSILT